MSISFSRSTRALENDSFRLPVLGLILAGLVLAAWGAWFVFARITIQETSTALSLDRDGGVIAFFTPSQLGRIQVGQSASVIIAATSGSPAQILRAEVAQVANRSANRMEPNTVRLYVYATPPATAPAQVQINVQEISPLTFVLRSGQALTTTGSGN
jgi:hypothetical protein